VLKILLRLAILNLLRNRNRTTIAALTVAGGIVAFLLAGGFINWIFQDMRDATIRSQLGHFQIVRPGFFEKGMSDPYEFLLPAKSEQELLVSAHPGLKALTPRLIFFGLASLGDTTVAFSGEGIDPVRERPISTRITISEGIDLSGLDDKSVILGEGLAKNLGAKPGSQIVLLCTAANGSASAIEVNVAGIFYTINKDFDNYALRIPISLARKLMRVDGATSWVGLLEDTDTTAVAVNELISILPAETFQLIPWTELADFYNKTVVLFSKQVDVIKIIIGLIIVLTISNIQTMTVLERTTEIGTILAVGVHSREIMLQFLLEGLVIGIAGGLVGVLLAVSLAELISHIGIPMPPPPGMARGFTGQIIINAMLVADALVLSTITTLVASLMPAWKASHLNIVDALRTNQ